MEDGLQNRSAFLFWLPFGSNPLDLDLSRLQPPWTILRRRSQLEDIDFPILRCLMRRSLRLWRRSSKIPTSRIESTPAEQKAQLDDRLLRWRPIAFFLSSVSISGGWIFCPISKVWSVLEQLKTQYQKHYANDADDLERYGFIKKSRVQTCHEAWWSKERTSSWRSETHCEATGHFPPIRQYDDCCVHRCGPHGTCVDRFNSHSCCCDLVLLETEVDRVKLVKVNDSTDFDNQEWWDRVCVPVHWDKPNSVWSGLKHLRTHEHGQAQRPLVLSMICCASKVDRPLRQPDIPSGHSVVSSFCALVILDCNALALTQDTEPWRFFQRCRMVQRVATTVHWAVVIRALRSAAQPHKDIESSSLESHTAGRR